MIARRFATVEPVFGNLRAQQGAQPLHLARPTEGRRAVEALLPGAQHREAGAQRVREVRRRIRAIEVVLPSL